MTAVEPVKVEVSDDQCVATVYFKELPYDDFGAAGILRPHKVNRLFEAGRVFSLQSGLVGGLAHVNDRGYGLFVLGLNYTYHPALWSITRGHSFPFKVETQLVDIGHTSLSLQSRLVNTFDHRTLATLEFKSIYVNRDTRRPAPLPQWVRSKYGPRVKGGSKLHLSKDSPEVPMSAYRYDVSVSESDTDHNGHTNQASYPRYCCDGTHAAVKEGHLPRLQPSAWLFPLLKMQTFHSGETLMGDRLRVFLWQQEDCPDTIRYVIQKQTIGPEKKMVVFHATMVFGQQSRL